MVCMLSSIPGLPCPRRQQHPQLLQPNQLQTLPRVPGGLRPQQLTSLLTPTCSPGEPQGCPHNALDLGLCLCAQHMRSACKDFQTYFNGYIRFYSVHVSQIDFTIFDIADNLVVLGNLFFFPT